MVKTESNLNNTCMWWGIFLIIASIIQLALPEVFDYFWGIIVLIIGIVTLVFRKRWNLAVIGAMFTLIGAYNIIMVLLTYTTSSFLVAGIVQIVIGLVVLNKYHKSDYGKDKSVGNWWKRQKTWEKVIIILAGLVIISVIWSALSLKTNSSNSDVNDENAKEYLEGKGYEVIYNYYSDVGNETWASVEMKSLGEINGQAWDGLITLGYYYTEADKYVITILTPTSECFYSINGNLYRNWVLSENAKDGKIITISGTIFTSDQLWKYIQDDIEEETKRCS